MLIFCGNILILRTFYTKAINIENDTGESKTPASYKLLSVAYL